MRLAALERVDLLDHESQGEAGGSDGAVILVASLFGLMSHSPCRLIKRAALQKRSLHPALVGPFYRHLFTLKSYQKSSRGAFTCKNTGQLDDMQ